MLCDNLKKARLSAGLTQTNLADMLDIKQQNVALWEKGSRVPRSDTLKRICETLHVSSDEMLDINIKS